MGAVGSHLRLLAWGGASLSTALASLPLWGGKAKDSWGWWPWEDTSWGPQSGSAPRRPVRGVGAEGTSVQPGQQPREGASCWGLHAGLFNARVQPLTRCQ